VDFLCEDGGNTPELTVQYLPDSCKTVGDK
jgi:hypothetical protein